MKKIKKTKSIPKKKILDLGDLMVLSLKNHLKENQVKNK